MLPKQPIPREHLLNRAVGQTEGLEGIAFHQSGLLPVYRTVDSALREVGVADRVRRHWACAIRAV